MAYYKHHKEPLIPSHTNSNPSISFPSILALAISIGALIFSETLLSVSTQNPQSSIMDLLVRFLLFVLVPVTFHLGTGLLFIRVAVASDCSRGKLYEDQINLVTKITVNMALVCLLTEVAIGIYLLLPEAVGTWWFVW